MTDTPLEVISEARNPWNNAYWFARWLIASEYGSPGNELKIMAAMPVIIAELLDATSALPENEAVEVLLGGVQNVLLGRWDNAKRRPNKANQVEAGFEMIADELKVRKDFEVLSLTCSHILLPTLRAFVSVPKSDAIFTASVAKALLDAQGEAGLATVINVTDKLGVRGCIDVERNQVVEQFGLLRPQIAHLAVKDQDVILTAFCQEFERRLGNARKGRAGQSLESITSLIMNYYGIGASEAPEHFTAALEIDRWVRTRDGWLIGISCKRTLRERWKQAYTDNIDLLNKFKIKALWHVLTFDRDLSDDKMTEMGSHRAMFYLPDDSPRLVTARAHIGMRDYVRPMTHFVSDLRREIEGEKDAALRRVAESRIRT